MRHKVFHKVKRGFERNQLAKNCEKKIKKFEDKFSKRELIDILQRGGNLKSETIWVKPTWVLEW